MAVEFELSLRPFKGRISRTPGKQQYVNRPIVLPFYRAAVRHVVQRLIDENKALRQDRQRQAAKLTTMLAKTLEVFLRERNRRR
jgi:hypothetical protein